MPQGETLETRLWETAETDGEDDYQEWGEE